MPARKKAAQKKTRSAVARRPASGLAPAGSISPEWREKMKDYAKRDAATATGALGWPYIGTRNGIFKFNDTALEELPPMIIVGARRENAYYEGKFDPENPTGPVCFALGPDEESLAPPESLGEHRQSLRTDPVTETCADCWANAFESADTGRGKACKNLVRLALLPADDLSPATLADVEGAMLRVSVTSVKAFSVYTNKVTKGIGVPLFMLRTYIEIEPDERTQFKISFSPYDTEETDEGLIPLLITDPTQLGVLESRVKEAEAYLDAMSTGDNSGERAEEKKTGKLPAKAGGRKKPTPRKAGARKKTTRAPSKY